MQKVKIHFREDKMKQDMIVILDLGSQNNTAIARAVRELGVFSEIHPHDISLDKLSHLSNVKGIIINGGKNNLVDGLKIDVNHSIYEAGYPVMAIDHEPAMCENRRDNWPETKEEIKEILRSFLFNICQAEPNWNMKNFIIDQVELIKKQVGDKKVLLALSGGVDSSVVAALLIKAIGKQLVCVHVNHGLMRKGESESVIEVFKNQMDANLIYAQYFTVVPDFKSVGIVPVIIRAINTIDAMTASIEQIDWPVLMTITVLNEVPHVNRVC
jgi:GMP synthase (glutamine-hydrolysing)